MARNFVLNAVIWWFSLWMR